MKVSDTRIPEVKVIEPRVFADNRGFLTESFNQRRMQEALGRPLHFVQDNSSRSLRHVLRGLHYQLPPFAQGKLVRVVRG
jgi:dTDP-4-dehydrorhamnose 3,5-epimerase